MSSLSRVVVPFTGRGRGHPALQRRGPSAGRGRGRMVRGIFRLSGRRSRSSPGFVVPVGRILRRRGCHMTRKAAWRQGTLPPPGVGSPFFLLRNSTDLESGRRQRPPGCGAERRAPRLRPSRSGHEGGVRRGRKRAFLSSSLYGRISATQRTPRGAWIWRFGLVNHIQQLCVVGHLYVETNDAPGPEEQ